MNRIYFVESLFSFEAEKYKYKSVKILYIYALNYISVSLGMEGGVAGSHDIGVFFIVFDICSFSTMKRVNFNTMALRIFSIDNAPFEVYSNPSYLRILL